MLSSPNSWLYIEEAITIELVRQSHLILFNCADIELVPYVNFPSFHLIKSTFDNESFNGKLDYFLSLLC